MELSRGGLSQLQGEKDVSNESTFKEKLGGGQRGECSGGWVDADKNTETGGVTEKSARGVNKRKTVRENFTKENKNQRVGDYN